MDMVDCPHCGTRVVLKGDRTCPSCRKKPDDPADVPVASRSGETAGRRSAIPTDFNPYQAPQPALSGKTAEVEAANHTGGSGGRTFKFYSPGQVGGAAVLGTPMAGFWLLASNDRKLGERFQAIRTLLLGVAITAVIFVFSSAPHNRIPAILIPVGYTWLIYQIANVQQGESYQEHLSLGGQKHSNWRVVGVSLICIIALLVVTTLVVAIIMALVVPMERIEE
jgi:heme exporter protein D